MRTAKYSKCGTAEFVVLDKTATVAVRTAGAVARAVRVTAGSVAGRVIDEMRSTYKCNKCGKTIDG